MRPAELPSDQPLTELDLNGMDPMVLLDHLGEGWSLATYGTNYDRPERHEFFVKGGTEIKKGVGHEYIRKTRIEIDHKRAGIITIQDQLYLDEDGTQSYGVDESISGMTTVFLRNDGDVLFASADKKRVYPFTNPIKKPATLTPGIAAEV